MPGQQSRRTDTLRVAIGAGNLRLSSIWSIKAKRRDLYVGVRNIMGSLKLSVHGAEDYRRCQIALTKEYWARSAEEINPRLPGRELASWSMPQIPEVGAAEIVSIWLPRNHLRKRAEKVNVDARRPILFIAPARPSAAVRIRLHEAKKLDADTLSFLRDCGVLIGHFEFDDQRIIAVSARLEEFDSSRLRNVLGGEGSGTTFRDVLRPGQTIVDLSGVTWTKPVDGQMVHLTEVHGLALRRNQLAKDHDLAVPASEPSKP